VKDLADLRIKMGAQNEGAGHPRSGSGREAAARSDIPSSRPYRGRTFLIAALITRGTSR